MKSKQLSRGIDQGRSIIVKWKKFETTSTLPSMSNKARRALVREVAKNPSDMFGALVSQHIHFFPPKVYGDRKTQKGIKRGAD